MWAAPEAQLQPGFCFCAASTSGFLQQRCSSALISLMGFCVPLTGRQFPNCHESPGPRRRSPNRAHGAKSGRFFDMVGGEGRNPQRP